MPAREPETYLYEVSLPPNAHGAGVWREVIAAYYLVEDGRVTFKDANHQAVYSVPADTAHEIRRIRPQAPTVDEIMRKIDAGTAAREEARELFGHNCGTLPAAGVHIRK